MDSLKKLGKAAAWLLAAAHVAGEVLGFLFLPALIVACGVLNEYPTEFYVYALGIYLVLYLAVRLIAHRVGKWVERKLEKK